MSNAGGLLIWLVSGAVIVVTIMKDISAEDYHSSAGGVFDATAGRSSQYDRHIHSLFHPIPSLGDLSMDMASKFFGPYIDLWRLILKHKLLYLQILFLSRYLQWLRPTVIVVWSAPVMEMFTEGLFRRVWSHVPTADMAGFQAGVSGDFLLPLIHNTAGIPRPKGSEHLDRVGILSIWPFASGDADISILVPLGDPGSIKYDPLLSLLRSSLLYLGQGIVEITKAVAQRKQMVSPISTDDRVSRHSYLSSIIREVDAILESVKLDKAIATVKKNLRLQVGLHIDIIYILYHNIFV